MNWPNPSHRWSALRRLGFGLRRRHGDPFRLDYQGFTEHRANRGGVCARTNENTVNKDHFKHAAVMPDLDTASHRIFCNPFLPLLNTATLVAPYGDHRSYPDVAGWQNQ